MLSANISHITSSVKWSFYGQTILPSDKKEEPALSRSGIWMYRLSSIKLTMLAALVLMALGVRGLTAPTTHVNQTAAPFPSISKRDPIPASDLVVVYVPYEPWREFTPKLSDFQKDLHSLLAKRGSQPLKTEDYVEAIPLKSQKDLFLGLLASKGMPVKHSNGDLEVLASDQASGKTFLVDRYGIVTDGLRSFQLSPLAFHKLHVLLDEIFVLPNGGWHSEPEMHPVMTPGLKSFQQRTGQVHSGMTNAEVRSLLGVPDLVEKYQLLNSRHWYEVWYWNAPDGFNCGYILEVDDTDHVLPAGIYPH